MSDLSSVEPLFIRDQDIINKNTTALDICHGCTAVIAAGQVDGVQKVNKLWRIYLKSKKARIELFLTKTLLVNGAKIPMYDVNPYSANYSNPAKPNDKLTIKNVPLSVSNDEFVRMLEDNGVELKSPVRYGYIRDVGGGLTDFKSGDRYVYVTPFHPPLPPNQKVGMFSCFIIHHGKQTKCASCGTAGHKVGDSICEAKPTEEIYAFRGYQHPLSNHYMCELKAYESTFKSVEHAFFWRMCTEMGENDLAARIKKSRHAGEAKRLSKEIVVWCKIHKKQHVSAFFGKSVLKCHLT